jgi:hypothetical protein
VQLSESLAADLRTLTDALERPGVDLQTALHAVGLSVAATTGSFLGLTMTMLADGLPYSFTVWNAPGDADTVAASLLVPLPAPVGDGSTLVLYASAAGAFVDLSADLAFALGLDLDSVRVNQHLTPPDAGEAAGLADLGRVNQAVGVLIDRGLLPHAARDELRRLAGAGADLGTVAQHVLDSVTPPAS